MFQAHAMCLARAVRAFLNAWTDQAIGCLALIQYNSVMATESEKSKRALESYK